MMWSYVLLLCRTLVKRQIVSRKLFRLRLKLFNVMLVPVCCTNGIIFSTKISDALRSIAKCRLQTYSLE